jgi:phage I-like protein
MFHPYTERAAMAESRAMNAVSENIAAPAAPRRTALGAAILAAGAAPEWIELIPAGEFAGRDGRGPYRLTNVAAVIEASQALRMDAGLPIDYDHATDFAAPAGRPAPAAGWIRSLEERDGALWGRVEWTRHGASAVAMREYRYISPVFEYAPNGEIVRLLRAALTNNPNLYLSAISSSAPPASGGPAGGEQELEVPMEDLGNALAEMLGLDSGAGAAEIIAEVRALLAARPAAAAAAREADPARFVPIAEYERTAAELNRLRAAQARERAEQEVGAAMRAGKIAPAQREWAIAYCQADAEAFRGFVARQPPLFAAGPAAADRAGSQIEMGRPPRAAAPALTRTEAAICERLGIDPQDYARRKEACSRDAFASERD